MAVLARRIAGSRRRMMSDINVVPYIDVMLVLVVILMVSAPFVNPSLVELPSVGKSTRAPDAPLVVIAGDKKAHYESVTRVLDALYKGNVRRVGLVVKPSE